MKPYKTITYCAIALFFMMTFGSCERINIGNATFYFSSNGPAANVTINSATAPVTLIYPNYPPACGSAGCATFALAPGTYNYTASSQLFSWSGTATVYDGQCTLVNLPQSTGSVTFWTATGSYGTIAVSVDNFSNSITQYYSGGGPLTCSPAGCANFLLPTGTYNYTASSQTGATWTGSITIAQDVCNYFIQLQ